jgi:hypothetical protein
MRHQRRGVNSSAPVDFSACWRTADVSGIAHAVYADYAFDRMPILADALEEAGCTDPAILDHCRAPGLHARGCWLLDLILLKQEAAVSASSPASKRLQWRRLLRPREKRVARRVCD